MRAAVLLGVLSIPLAGCGLFGGPGGSSVADKVLPYEARLAVDDEAPRNVEVLVLATGASVSDVRESARFPVTRHCLSNFGGSDAVWENDPATGDWAVTRTEQGMIFSARCIAR